MNFSAAAAVSFANSGSNTIQPVSPPMKLVSDKSSHGQDCRIQVDFPDHLPLIDCDQSDQKQEQTRRTDEVGVASHEIGRKPAYRYPDSRR
jgi:hypothetical protein